MPCDSIVKISVDLKAMNRAVLMRALKAEGWTVSERRGIIYAQAKDYRSVEIHPDRAVFQKGNEDLVDKINTAYTKDYVRTAAKQFGATVTFKQDNSFTFKMQSLGKSQFTQKSSF